MKTMTILGEEDVQVYANACTGRFAMKQDGQRWVKEFPTLGEVIRFMTGLSHEKTVRVILHDEVGHHLTEFVLRPC